MTTPRKNRASNDTHVRNFMQKSIRSIWLFPVLITILLALLVGFKISGSSMSIYNNTFGEKQTSNLLANQPRSVRSDEWLVNSQLTLAQKNNDYQRVNDNIGNGLDVSVLIDAPYKEWSVIFKPHNLAFFILPFDNAFAFKWWFMAYLLLLSCYFFIVTLMPNKILFGALVSCALLFSPFVQWWYLYGVLGSLYYSLFGAILFMKILAQDDRRKQLGWALLLSYVMACFALILYPPFMLPCIIAMAAFALGYSIEKFRTVPRKVILQKLGMVAGAVILAGVISVTFLATRESVVKTISGTVYPGKRVVTGGGYDVTKLYSGYLEAQLQTDKRAVKYKLNQSENSNFIIVAPYLMLPVAYLLIRQRRKKQPLDWPLLLVSAAMVVIWIRLFTPLLDPLLNPLLFSKIPINRLIIGVGILNLLQFVLFVRHIQSMNIKKYRLATNIYTVLVLATTIGLGLWTHSRFPDYIGAPKAILLSMTMTLVIYLLLTKRFVLCAALFFLLSFYSTYRVNPILRGTASLSETPVSKTIRNIASESDGKWVSETLDFENFPQMNGARALSGVYPYPQLSIWKDISPKNPGIYNRYAHVIFVINHSNSDDYKTNAKLLQNDLFLVYTEPCSDFMRQQGVKYILAQAPIENTCVKLRATVDYPSRDFYVYEIR